MQVCTNMSEIVDCLEWPELWLRANVVPILHLFINLTMSFSFMPIWFIYNRMVLSI